MFPTTSKKIAKKKLILQVCALNKGANERNREMKAENINIGDILHMDGIIKVKVVRKIELNEGDIQIVVRPQTLTSFYTLRCVPPARLAPLVAMARAWWSLSKKLLL